MFGAFTIGSWFHVQIFMAVDVVVARVKILSSFELIWPFNSALKDKELPVAKLQIEALFTPWKTFHLESRNTINALISWKMFILKNVKSRFQIEFFGRVNEVPIYDFVNEGYKVTRTSIDPPITIPFGIVKQNEWCYRPVVPKF